MRAIACKRRPRTPLPHCLTRPSACSWLDDDLQFQSAWVRQHALDAAALGKPVRAASNAASVPACITGFHPSGDASQQAWQQACCGLRRPSWRSLGSGKLRAGWERDAALLLPAHSNLHTTSRQQGCWACRVKAGTHAGLQEREIFFRAMYGQVQAVSRQPQLHVCHVCDLTSQNNVNLMCAC